MSGVLQLHDPGEQLPPARGCGGKWTMVEAGERGLVIVAPAIIVELLAQHFISTVRACGWDIGPAIFGGEPTPEDHAVVEAEMDPEAVTASLRVLINNLPVDVRRKFLWECLTELRQRCRKCNGVSLRRKTVVMEETEYFACDDCGEAWEEPTLRAQGLEA